MVKVWQAKVGHVTLYLLDTDLPENSERDRDIAHRLYGGDRVTRLEQEFVLGVGGARALAALGHKPTVWHINEGHAAFLVLERIRGLAAQGLPLDAAIEAVAANTVFTTHTPVPAGHDHFPDADGRRLPEGAVRRLNVPALGRPPAGGDFNMTALAHARLALPERRLAHPRRRLGAPAAGLTGRRSRREENPLGYVTNGVHVATFLAPEWSEVLDRFLGVGWMHRLGHPGIWEKIRAIPDHIFWSVRQDIKARLFHMVRHRIGVQHTRNHGSESHLERAAQLRRSRRTRTCSPSASAGASPPTSAPRCCSTTSTTCAACSPTARARCCSCSPARRTRPTSPARS